MAQAALQVGVSWTHLLLETLEHSKPSSAIIAEVRALSAQEGRPFPC